MKAILFDLDNTLIETSGAGEVALQKVIMAEASCWRKISGFETLMLVGSARIVNNPSYYFVLNQFNSQGFVFNSTIDINN